MPTTTRAACIRQTGEEQGDLESGVATAGASTTLDDTSSDSPLSKGLQTDYYKARELYVHTGTLAGEGHIITAYTPASQRITVGETVTYGSTSEYYILRHIFYAERVLALNRVLTEHLKYKTWTPLTLLPDGDMETSGTASWAQSATTLTKDTGVGNVLFGTQSLKCVTTNATNYVESTAIPCEGNVVYFVQAWVRATTAGTITLNPYDKTNSAAIALSGTATIAGTASRDWYRLVGTFVTPATCVSLAIRVQTATNTDTYYVDDIPLYAARDVYPLPSWCDNKKTFEWVWYGKDRKHPDISDFEAVWNCEGTWDLTSARAPGGTTAGNPGGFVTLAGYPRNKALYVSGTPNFAALTTDTATTTAPIEWIKAELGLELIKLKWRKGIFDRETYLQEMQEWWPRVIAARREYEPQKVNFIRFPLRAS